MNRCVLLPAVYLADQIAGDPEWFPHPVRIMGLAIARGETALRHTHQSRAEELIAGAALTLALVGTSYSLTRLVINRAYRCSKILGWLTEATLGWMCLAARNLEQEATSVTEALESGEVAFARQRLARIVGRDTQQLDVHEISRAVIETVAESASDGVIAPLFYMSIGGVPLAMAYKAVNTLDSMIGYADARYFYFGKTAARLDDAVNYLPARLTALAIVAASWIGSESDVRTVWKVWLRDGSKHKSPNAGQPESTMAGALRVRLGGGNFYGGEFIPSDPIGEEFPAPQSEQARKAIRLLSAVTLLGLGAGILVSVFIRRGKSK
jgi:adenosylcobinamide-phosphate synthase